VFTFTTLPPVQIAVPSPGSSNALEIATLVIAAVAALLALANVILSAWLNRRDEHAKWRRDALCAAVVDMIVASKRHTQAIRDNDKEPGRKALDEVALHLARIELFSAAKNLELLATVLWTDHVRLQHSPGNLDIFRDVFNDEQALIAASKRELGLPQIAAPTPPSPQSVPPNDGE